MIKIFEELRKYCPYGIISRKEVGKLTGGLLTPGTIAQLDHKKIGIPNRKTIGNKTVYNIDDVIDWLERNVECINFEQN